MKYLIIISLMLCACSSVKQFNKDMPEGYKSITIKEIGEQETKEMGILIHFFLVDSTDNFIPVSYLIVNEMHIIHLEGIRNFQQLYFMKKNATNSIKMRVLGFKDFKIPAFRITPGKMYEIKVYLTPSE